MRKQAIFLVILMLIISCILSGCTQQTKINNNSISQTAGANENQTDTSSTQQNDKTILDLIFGFLIHNPKDKFIGTWNTTTNFFGLKEMEITFFINDSFKLTSIVNKNALNGGDEVLISNTSWGTYIIQEMDDLRGDLLLGNFSYGTYLSYSFHYNKMLVLTPLMTGLVFSMCFHKK